MKIKKPTPSTLPLNHEPRRRLAHASLSLVVGGIMGPGGPLGGARLFDNPGDGSGER
jgi:hypothetical protein